MQVLRRRVDVLLVHHRRTREKGLNGGQRLEVDPQFRHFSNGCEITI